MAKVTMRKKHQGKPALYDDIDAEWSIMWLVSIPMLEGKIEPIRVRARKTEYGWRGWHVGGNPSKAATHWFGHLWRPATPEETARFNEEFGITVCDVTQEKSA